MTAPIPAPFLANYGIQSVDSNGNPLYSPAPVAYGNVTTSATEPLSPVPPAMPAGMAPMMPGNQGVIGSLGNTPMTDSVAAMQAMVRDQTEHMTLVTQMVDQMQSTMDKTVKGMESDFSRMKRHTEEMAAIQIETQLHMLNQIKATMAATGQGTQPGAPTGAGARGAGNHPADEGRAVRTAVEDRQQASQAHPADSPEGRAGRGVQVGHGRFRTRPSGILVPEGTEQPDTTPDGIGHEKAPPPEEPHAVPQQPRRSKTTFAEYRQMSIPDMLQRAAGHAAQTLGRVESRYRTETTPEGAERTVLADTGEPAGIAGTAAKNTAGHVGGALGRYASTGEMGGILGALETPAGIAAAGYMAARTGLHIYQGQQQKNMFYQQITGGSNWGSGVMGRARESAFAYSNMFNMPGAQARELYKGVAEMAPGQTQTSRDLASGALDFAVHQYKTTGLEVADSLQLIRTNMQHGVESFNNLNAAITTVSDTAKAAGQNSMEAIKNFSQLYGAVLGTVTASGPTASQISSSITNTATSWGKQLGLQSSNFTGRLSGQGMYMSAQALGMTPTQLETQMALPGPQSAVTAAQASQSGYTQLYQQIGGQATSQAATAYAKTLNLPNDGKGQSASEDDQIKVGSYLMNNGLVPTPDAVIAMAQADQLGQFSVSQITQIVGMLALNNGDTGVVSQAKSAANAQGGANTSPTKIAGQKIITNQDVKNAPQQPQYGHVSAGRAAENTQQGALSPQDIQGNKLEKSLGNTGWEAQKYIGMVQSRGKRDPMAEELLKNQKNWQGHRFIVKTSEGDRTVSYKELFNTYKDQLSAGQVRDADTGNTLSDETNIQGESGVKVTSSSRKPPKGSKKYTAPSGQGVITIKPSAELSQWFQFTGSGGITIDQANRSGVPANAFYPDPTQMPSATGN